MNTIKHTIFIGILLTPDLAFKLEKNPKWKRYRIVHGDDISALQVVPFEHKQYLGKYFDSDKISWVKLQIAFETLRTNLEQFFPALQQDKNSVVLFTQAMVT